MAETFYLAPDRSAVEKLLGRKRTSNVNLGLIWDRYFPVWEGSPDRPDRGKVHDPLSAFAKDFNAAGSRCEEQLRDRRQRFERALVHLENVSRQVVFGSTELQLVWRLATGVGSDHPTENGFAFDTLTGVPYLTGSAVKGVCRRAADLDGMGEGEMERLFGPVRVAAAESGFQGELSFFDAFPQRWPSLVVDVVNCHHPDYYRRLGENRDNGPAMKRGEESKPIPWETEDPVPVFFLTVDNGVSFTFPIGARSRADVERAMRVLELGLDWLGIGAKTAVGYGTFRKMTASSPKDANFKQPGGLDPFQVFKDWFGKQGFQQGRNKGQLDLVRHQVCGLPIEQRAKAIDFVRESMRKVMKRANLDSLLAKLEAPCE